MSLSMRRQSLGLFVLFWGAAFSSTVAGELAHSAAMTQRIDALLEASWTESGVQPASRSNDAEFLRRVYLDLTGSIPTVAQARRFLKDEDPSKRTKLIDELLTRPGHANHMAATWRRFLLPENTDLRRFGNAVAFENWLADQFADNVPYHQIARQLLLASGQYNQGPALFYAALELKPDELAAATSRALLGVQIQCAQCHNHPFDQWTQEDFWGYAAFFAQLEQPGNPQQRFIAQIADAEEGELRLPDTDEIAAPKFLGGPVLEDRGEQTRRQHLADWIISNDNPYFTRAAVNRMWAHLFGRGLVDPVDDFGEHNDPSHPQLLDELAVYFREIHFDVRNLIATLANTRAYQLSSRSIAGEKDRPELFARMAIKTLTAEQLYDCLSQSTARRQGGSTGQFNAANRNFNNARNTFINKFRAPGGSATEFHNGVPQALTLMNGGDVRSATDLEQSDILVALTAPFLNDQQRVETLFLSTLSRFPRESEREKFMVYVSSKSTNREKREALGDILWALLNSAEFCLNH